MLYFVHRCKRCHFFRKALPFIKTRTNVQIVRFKVDRKGVETWRCRFQMDLSARDVLEQVAILFDEFKSLPLIRVGTCVFGRTPLLFFTLLAKNSRTSEDAFSSAHRESISLEFTLALPLPSFVRRLADYGRAGTHSESLRTGQKREMRG